jgi:adenine-specific DNA-methyltransferase
MAVKKKARPAPAQTADSYQHKTADSPMRPEVGTQSQFRKRKPPKTYWYDSSLDPALSWDGNNGSRALGEWLLARITEAASLPAPHRLLEPQKFLGADGKVLASVRSLEDAIEQLKAIERPFLNWTGKAERLSFDIPTLPLFIHERLSTQAILETLKGHRRSDLDAQLDLFGDPHHSIVEQSLRAYEHRDRWVNRMILGDSLAVMNSLLEYEGMGGQVQMIYIDPPYGVRFGSNFQPFVRKRDVSHNDDDDMTREPEMVQAYRDTWELGLHSYLTYLRDRLLLARELLTASGSIFVQISDENLHHVRELLDEVFGTDNFCALIPFRKTSGAGNPNGLEAIGSIADYLIWYSRDSRHLKYRQLYVKSEEGRAFDATFTWVSDENGKRQMTKAERKGEIQLEGRRFARADLSAQNDNQMYSFQFEGITYTPKNRGWRTTEAGMKRLEAADRLIVSGKTLRFIQYADDFAFSPLQGMWEDTGTGSFLEDKLYVVQTGTKVLERCIQMCSDPGDLVLDPTCGSGTTAYVAEQWGRRWITVDTSRVPLALARQRLLTATFPWFDLVDEGRGPAGGFIYKRKQNRNGEEVGGIVPHVTLKSIATNEPPEEEILVDRPETDERTTRVTGPFCVEATIPTVADLEGLSEQPEAENIQAMHEERPESFVDRMIEILKRSPLLRLPGNRSVKLNNIRKPAKSLSLQAEALVAATAEGQDASIADAAQEALEESGDLLGGLTKRPVAFVFGPENGAISEKLVFEAAREAQAKNYTHLYAIGFAIHPNARQLTENAEQMIGIRATYVQMTPDVLMGDLLKNMRSSQIFSVCGLPEIELRKRPDGKYEVELLGLDVFDPVTAEAVHSKGDDVPAWFLDTDYNGLCFLVSQAFFPRTSAWESLKKALRTDYEATVWDHLAGTVSAPFEPNGHQEIAVKVIDDRGNELLVTKKIAEAKIIH